MEEETYQLSKSCPAKSLDEEYSNQKKTCAKALRQEKTCYSWGGQIVTMGRVQRALSSGRGSGREKSEMKKRRRRKRKRRGRRGITSM